MKCRNEIMNSITLFPGVPAVVVRMSKLLRDPDVSMKELVETLKYDPILTARVLRLANSAQFGVSGTVSTLRDAFVRLGTTRLYRLVISSCVEPILKQPLAGYSLESGELWRHSVAVGLAAEKIEDLLSDAKTDLAFTAGLLHDIGMLVIASYVERDFEAIEEKSSREELSFESAEKAVLDIDHSEAGVALLEKWGFPADLITVAQWHHTPDLAPPEKMRLVDVVHVADMTCMLMGIGLGREGLQYIPSTESISRLGLKQETLELVASRTLSAMDGILAMFANVEGNNGL